MKLFLLSSIAVVLVLATAPKHTCAQTVVEDCVPTSLPADPIRGIYEGLLGFFTYPTTVLSGLLAQPCVNPRDEFLRVTYGSGNDNGQYRGKTRCRSDTGAPIDQLYQQVTVTRGTAQRQESVTYGWIPNPFEFPFTGLFETDLKFAGLYPSTKSELTPAINGLIPDTLMTGPGYFGGAVGTDPVKSLKKVEYVINLVKDRAVLEELYEDAGAFHKLSMPERKYAGTWLTKEEALRHKFLAAVVRGWLCFFERTHCDGEQAWDIPVAFVSGSTKIGPTCPDGERCREFFASEAVCKLRPQLEGISEGELVSLCEGRLGLPYEGAMSPGGLFYQKFAPQGVADIHSPGLHELINLNWYDFVAETDFGDMGGTGLVETFRGEQDPDPSPGSQYVHSGNIALAGGARATAEFLCNTASLMSPPEVNTKRLAERPDIPRQQCVRTQIGYQASDENGGSLISDIIHNLRRVLTVQPPSQPPPSGDPTAEHTFGRAMGVAMPVMWEQVRTVLCGTHPEFGMGALLTPPEVVENFKSDEGTGVPVYMMSASQTVESTGNYQVDPISALPTAGGPTMILTGSGTNKQPASLIAQYVYPPEAIKGQNAGAFIRNLAQGKYPQPLSQEIFSDLASFKKSDTAEK